MSVNLYFMILYKRIEKRSKSKWHVISRMAKCCGWWKRYWLGPAPGRRNPAIEICRPHRLTPVCHRLPRILRSSDLEEPGDPAPSPAFVCTGHKCLGPVVGCYIQPRGNGGDPFDRDSNNPSCVLFSNRSGKMISLTEI